MAKALSELVSKPYRFYQGLEQHQSSLTQFMISVLEDILANIKTKPEIDYIQQRICFYEERCLGENDEINGPLSLAEIAEFHAIAHDYYATYERVLADIEDPTLHCHLAMVKTVRDSLGAMLHG